MKKLATQLFAIVFIIGLGGALNAQKSEIGINLRAGVPIGDFAEYAGFGIGGGVNYSYFLGDNTSIGMEVGYMSFMENDLSDEITGSSVAIPIIANVRYRFSEEDEFRPFIGLGLGATVIQQTTTVDLSAFGGEIDEFDGTYSGFTIAPQLGFTTMIADNVNLYFAADYSYILNEAEGYAIEDDQGNPVTGGPQVIALDPYSYIGFNVGVTFGLGDM